LSEGSPALRLDGLLFGETQGRILISSAAADAVKVISRAKILDVSATQIGIVGGDSLEIKSAGSGLSCSLVELHDLWWNSIARVMN
jgi:hypothetical protein